MINALLVISNLACSYAAKMERTETIEIMIFGNRFDVWK
jgi:hypothetical protein